MTMKNRIHVLNEKADMCVSFPCGIQLEISSFFLWASVIRGDETSNALRELPLN